MVTEKTTIGALEQAITQGVEKNTGKKVESRQKKKFVIKVSVQTGPGEIVEICGTGNNLIESINNGMKKAGIIDGLVEDDMTLKFGLVL